MAVPPGSMCSNYSHSYARAAGQQLQMQGMHLQNQKLRVAEWEIRSRQKPESQGSTVLKDAFVKCPPTAMRLFSYFFAKPQVQCFSKSSFHLSTSIRGTTSNKYLHSTCKNSALIMKNRLPLRLRLGKARPRRNMIILVPTGRSKCWSLHWYKTLCSTSKTSHELMPSYRPQ